LQAPVDPADQVAASNVADEQVQGIRRLVEPSVAQPVIGSRAMVDKMPPPENLWAI
jgi:hypothetical protein